MGVPDYRKCQAEMVSRHDAVVSDIALNQPNVDVATSKLAVGCKRKAVGDDDANEGTGWED